MKGICRQLCTAVLLTLSACASDGPTLSSEGPARYRNIAVITLVGDRYADVHVGLLVFTNAITSVDIRPWQLRDAYTEAMAAALRKAGVRQVQKPDFDYAALRAPFDPEKNTTFLGQPSIDWDAAEAPLRQLAASHHADAVVVIAPADVTDYIGHTTVHLSGLGLYGHGGSAPMLHAYLSASAILFDGATGKRVRVETVAPASHNFLGNISASDLPEYPLPESFEGKHHAQFSALELEQLRVNFTRLLDHYGADATVPRLLAPN